MATAREKNYDEFVVPGAEKAKKYLDTKTSHVAGQTWDHGVPIPSIPGKTRAAGTVLGYIDHNVNLGFARLEAAVDGLTKLVAATSSNPGIDEAQVRQILEEAASKAFGTYQLARVEDAADAVEVTLDEKEG